MATTFDSKKTAIRKEDALEYHAAGRPGKIEVVPTKPVATSRDLSLAYSPGVAQPCLEIANNPDLSYTYTARGNLVAVLSNGTAVLGLGNIGALAGKPVMEGKGVLFKKFADIDVFDIEVNTQDPEELIRVVKALEPTFGGINLEDIKAPECFYVEERLKAEMNIPVFHDDQHGTAIISGAALLNALELQGKKIDEVRVVVSGAGASAMACSKFYIRLGVRPENLLLCDTKGVVYKGRKEGMNPYKEEFARETRARTLADALVGADVLLGCSTRGLVTPEMVKTMAKRPIIFALANPDPEIDYDVAREARPDCIMATGRSDYPNQVNNVLGFPFIFRGALDVRARAINEEMKLAAARALAALAREEVPESVTRAYGVKKFVFGPEYIIPKPFDPRVLIWVAPAVAQAAMESGVARLKIDLAEYKERLRRTQSRGYAVMHGVMRKARRKSVRILFPEGNNPKVLHAAQVLAAEGICQPVLLGNAEQIRASIAEQHLSALSSVEIVTPAEHEKFEAYARELWRIRQRRGMTLRLARKALMNSRTQFAVMMLHAGDADGLVTGMTLNYPQAMRPILSVLKPEEGKVAAGLYLVVGKREARFLADCTVNPDPSAEMLAQIAIQAADVARSFDVEPRVAMLSYSNFGSSRRGSPQKVREAVRLVHERRPDIVCDGEMQLDPAVVPELAAEAFPFSAIQGDANVLVFPNLDAANIAYKLLWRLGGAEIIGPILMGMKQAVNVIPFGAGVSELVNLAAVTAVKAQGDERF